MSIHPALQEGRVVWRVAGNKCKWWCYKQHLAHTGCILVSKVTERAGSSYIMSYYIVLRSRHTVWLV